MFVCVNYVGFQLLQIQLGYCSVCHGCHGACREIQSKMMISQSWEELSLVSIIFKYLSLSVATVIVMVNDNVCGASSWHSHCESSPSSCDKCSTRAGQLPTSWPCW